MRRFMFSITAASAVAIGYLVTPLVQAQTDATVQTEARGSDQPSPQMQAVLNVYESIAGTPVIELTPQDARQQPSAQDAAKIIARASGKAKAPEPGLVVTDGAVIPTAAGDIPIRIYTPQGAGPLPVVVYFHGGGFVIATNDTYDASARALATLSGAIVVAVEYRKAPEHPYPAALTDAVAAYRWVLANAASFNGNAAKVAVAGESAGGNLATEVCLAARDQGFAIPVYQLLVYPVTDFAKMGYYSERVHANAVPLSTPALLYFGKYYLTNPADAAQSSVSPLYATLTGLPPATIIGAQIDPLQDQGRDYGTKLKAAGVAVNYKLYTGVTHEFFGMGAVVDEAAAAEALAGADLKKAFGN